MDAANRIVGLCCYGGKSRDVEMPIDPPRGIIIIIIQQEASDEPVLPFF